MTPTNSFTNYVNNIVNQGFAVRDGVVDAAMIESLKRELERLAGKAFGLRNLMNVVPFTRTSANSAALISLVEPVLGRGARSSGSSRPWRCVVCDLGE